MVVVKVAVVQSAPVLFDKEATIQKAVGLVKEAAGHGAKIVLFPEAYVSVYPRGLTFGMKVGSRTPEGRRTWERYWANSIEVPGPDTKALGVARARAKQVRFSTLSFSEECV